METLTLSDGRTLEYLVEGAADGDTTLVFHVGSPSAAVPFEQLDRAARELGVRVVSASRPGLGGSTRQPGRTVASVVPDVVELVDHLEVDRFIVAGWSGGGPHALACAALVPDRVLSAATIASVAPWDADGLDWTAGMGEDNAVEYTIAASDPDELLRRIEPEAAGMATITSDALVAGLRSLLSPVDEAALDPIGDMMAHSFRSAFRDGLWGAYDDDLAFTRPWGFDVESITGTVTVWHGAQDRFVPYAHGEWLAAHIPGARAELRPEHGHLSLAIDSLPEIVGGLVSSAGLH